MSMEKTNKRILDGKECFTLWYTTSSLYKTQRILDAQGIRNPQTGRVPTVMGISDAAWVWALENLDEAKKLYSDIFRSNGELLSDENWKRVIEKKARYNYVRSKKKLAKFLAVQGSISESL